MALVCSLSGTTPEEPVFSPTGYIFEKRLIEKYLKTSSTCPVTKEDLKFEDLKPISTSKVVRPRPDTSTTIPGILSTLQNEWDAAMVETYSLKQNIDQLRNQLSHSLYQHDASCRVIARLIKERDQFRNRVTQLQEELEASDKVVDQNINPRAAAVESDPGLSDAMVQEISSVAQKLLSQRKKRNTEMPMTPDKLRTTHCTDSWPLSSTTPAGGLRCVSVDAKSDGGSIVCAGAEDHKMYIFDLVEKKTLARLDGHIGGVNCVQFHPSLPVIISGSKDKTIRIWSQNEMTKMHHTTSHVMRRHDAQVKSVSIHPIQTCFASCALDKSWGLHEVSNGRTLRMENNLQCNYTCLQFHPDGLIVGGGGEDGSIFIWDIKSKKQQLMASLQEHKQSITAIAFSENGYHLASASIDNTVRLWDLRKSLVFQTLQPEGNGTTDTVTFDQSGNIIGTSRGSQISLYYFMSRSSAAEVVKLFDHEKAVTDLRFGPDASYLISTSVDRHLKYWEPKSSETPNMFSDE